MTKHELNLENARYALHHGIGSVEQCFAAFCRTVADADRAERIRQAVAEHDYEKADDISEEIL